MAELRLMLKSVSFGWYVVAAGLWIWTAFAPDKTQSMALGMAWIWPILVWSQMGTREAINDTELLVYPSLHPLRRQFVAQLCAGVVVALLAGSGAMLHDFASGDTAALFGVVTGALFIPTLALACGSIGATTRAFEVLFLTLWYLGPMNASSLDFTASSNAPGFALATLVLGCAAFAARKARLQTA